ncbi:MAG TPA: ATP-binding protein [Chloroflexi bacterium]|nr:ATP-binding protein [Chloroflexota bacterium]
MDLDALRVTAEQLRRPAALEALTFGTTAELEEIAEFVSHKRAVEAIELGLGIRGAGFNIYALGPTGLDKRGVVATYFHSRAQETPTPSDWCYVHNFAEEHRPLAIELPAGKGKEFRDAMAQLVTQLGSALSAAFESEEYQVRRQSILEELQERQAEAFEALQRNARNAGMALIRTPGGIVVAPTRDGEVLSPEEIAKLSEEEQAQIKERMEGLQEELQAILRQVPRWQRETQERLEALNREMAGLAVGVLFDELRRTFGDYPRVVEHLHAVQEDVIAHADLFLSRPDGQTLLNRERALQRYAVNVLIDNSETQGAPVIYEDNPTYQNLVGRVEHRAEMGALTTDFTLIKAGALHRANGGYLILDVAKVLGQPYAWEGLKRALKSRSIRIESLGQQLSLISTVTLEPEPIPLDVKVALVGNRLLYYLLWELDPEFADLFKVAADFEEEMPRDPEHELIYARLVATLGKRAGLRPFERLAVAHIIEQSARIAGDAHKLSTRMRDITDLMHEADYWAGKAGRDVVTVEDVDHAIDAQIQRLDRVRDRLQEAILRDLLLISTEGKTVGQVNGLSVMTLGSFSFGRPTRITASVRAGKGEVIDIEREVELGGPIHSKGVMILTGFLNGRYAREIPLSLSASLVFEQSYSGIEGDSASSAELYALLSAIAEVPLKQSLAVTGSVNQRGDVQAIGGVNEKIEGFFDLCRARGLTGEQGVIIPRANVQHLMLRHDVVEAVAKGQFHIYAVDSVDQGIELLTGVPCGVPDESGAYPPDSINARVQAQLEAWAQKRRALEKSPEEADGE